MTSKLIVILILFASLVSESVFCQVDNDPPVAPRLTFLTVQVSNGKPLLEWSKSPSADVSGYVLYYFTNDEGHAFDTIHDPNTTSYVNMGSSAEFLAESYVIAAIDTAGNISPLSNELNTVLPQISVDSCKRLINLSWNSYASYPTAVTGYTLMVSENGGAFTRAGQTSASSTSFAFEGIKPAINYCFSIAVSLESGMVSNSSVKCRQVQMERPPDWMNADYATINENGNISLSFTIDPLSEIKTFFINRKRIADNDFVSFTNIPLSNNNVLYTDLSAKSTEQYSYWLLAINNCGVPSETSNIAGNIVLNIKSENDLLKLTWNSYRKWNGDVSNYMIYLNTGNGFILNNVMSPVDTVFIINYHEIMNDVTAGNLCFYIEANENTNLYGITGKGRSNTVCLPDIENITVPNAFTPDNDNLNDFFKPVLSFTPSEYHLIITDRQNNKLFETSDHLQAWDGTKSGTILPADVYLWFMKVRTPSGRVISKTGTIAIVKTR